MEAIARSKFHPLIILASIAVIIFSAAGVAAIMGWIPASRGDAAPSTAAAPALHANAALPGAQGTVGAARKPRPHSAQVAAAEPNAGARASGAIARCTDCGAVTSVREVDQAGQGSGVGAVGGAVAGGVLGHQVGGGSGKDIMTVVGAVAGGIAGHQIEKKVRTTRNYEISVRMDDGSTRVLTEPSLPTWRAGDRVKLIDGRLQAEKS